MSGRQNIVSGQYVSPTMWETAKQLRHRLTPEERLLWQHIRADHPDHLHFRRQQIIGSFVVDFYCHAAGLVVELDGGIHETQVERDHERDAFLMGYGLQVLRFKNEQVRDNLDAILEKISKICLARIKAASATPTKRPDIGKAFP